MSGVFSFYFSEKIPDNLVSFKKGTSKWWMVNNDAITIVPVKSHAKKKWNKKLVFSELGLVLFSERIMGVASYGNTEAI